MLYPNNSRLATLMNWNSNKVRRVFDFFVSLSILIILSPLFLVLALLIKLDSKGPAFFKQKRNGLDGKAFNIYKFRTMYMHEANDFVQQASENDPRVTKIGVFLRKTSLDELPQLINVVRGDMAIVGPRPHAISHDEYYSRIIPNYLNRQAVRPGITGLAQCLGYRGETKHISQMKQRIDADVQYVKNNSFLLDIEIIVRTALIVLSMKNAH